MRAGAVSIPMRYRIRYQMKIWVDIFKKGSANEDSESKISCGEKKFKVHNCSIHWKLMDFILMWFS